MKRIKRRTAYATFALALSIALTGLCVRSVAGPPQVDTDDAVALSDPALILRGEYLAKLGDCAGCHTVRKQGAPFAGGLAMGSPFGTIYSTNITPDPQTGIGRYSYADFERALRDGVAPGGKRLYPAMPYASFTKINDADMHALYAYFMHGVQPVTHRPPETKLPFPFSQRWGLAFWDFAFVRHERFIPDSKHDALWNRGAYIVQSLGHCGACHTPRGPGYEERGYDESSKLYLTGGTNDHWFAPNLTGDPGSGLGRLSPRDIASFLKSGHGSDTHVVAFGSMVEVVEDSAQYFNDEDLDSIAHYLKSLPAREPSGAYAPGSPEAHETAISLKTGDVERPGAGLYMSFCAKCHHADGRGESGKYPALAGNPTVLASDTSSLVRLVLKGGSSPQTLKGPVHRKMPAFADQFTDAEVARVLSFVRGTWGNRAAPVSTRDVAVLRGKLKK
ncbi:Gluconate 2-dehydrogenase cytochrome c subunit [Paraburkholderia kirstenboschensis]|uniref:c-type cytochrome n=1 Tax=Paraburkholderia kirstenboschensis TaxID=1245436 RepID=UPI001918C80B|nr:cytochrome c [Paraburkholderia kirstenboschensis]CAD6558272.1 Gluconate 2-dehydrogenase cytochrome c subunit [Paraburkholderia kirstenboschensis]